MKFQSITVTARTDGARVSAELARCEHCNGTAFCAYKIFGQEGWHLQCLKCGACYCMGHECEPQRGIEPHDD